MLLSSCAAAQQKLRLGPRVYMPHRAGRTRILAEDLRDILGETRKDVHIRLEIDYISPDPCRAYSLRT